MKELVWGIMIIALIFLFSINQIAIRRKNLKNNEALQYVNNIKTLVPNINMRKSNEYYKVNNFFRMYNTGTNLDDDPGQIVYKEIGGKEDYYL